MCFKEASTWIIPCKAKNTDTIHETCLSEHKVPCLTMFDNIEVAHRHPKQAETIPRLFHLHQFSGLDFLVNVHFAPEVCSCIFHQCLQRGAS